MRLAEDQRSVLQAGLVHGTRHVHLAGTAYTRSERNPTRLLCDAPARQAPTGVATGRNPQHDYLLEWRFKLHNQQATLLLHTVL